MSTWMTSRWRDEEVKEGRRMKLSRAGREARIYAQSRGSWQVAGGRAEQHERRDIVNCLVQPYKFEMSILPNSVCSRQLATHNLLPGLPAGIPSPEALFKMCFRLGPNSSLPLRVVSVCKTLFMRGPQMSRTGLGYPRSIFVEGQLRCLPYSRAIHPLSICRSVSFLVVRP